MQNKLFIARTKAALKARAELNGLDLNEYFLIPISEDARKDKVMKSIAGKITESEYRYMLIRKSFCVITNEGKLQVNTNMLSENAYAQDLNTPEEEAVGDKVVEGGVLKSLLAKVKAGGNAFTKAEREVLVGALKSWGEHHGEPISEEDQIVDELEQKTVDADEDVEEELKSEAVGGEDEEVEEGDEGEDEGVEGALTKSVRDRLAGLRSAGPESEMMANLKSFGSLSTEAPVFSSKAQARRFSQMYNAKVQGTVGRAEVAAADRETRTAFGSRAKFIVEVN